MSLPRPITEECPFTYGSSAGIDLDASASCSSSSSSLKGNLLLYCCDSASSSTMCSSKQTDSASLVVDVESQKKNNDDAAMIDILLHLLGNDIDINIDNYCSARPPPPPPDSCGSTGNIVAVSTVPDSYNSHELGFFSWDELWESNPVCSVGPKLERDEAAETVNEWEIDEWMLDAEMDFGASGGLGIQDP